MKCICNTKHDDKSRPIATCSKGSSTLAVPTMSCFVVVALAVSMIPMVSCTTSSNSRPPFCMSSIINDLEAEDHSCVGIATATLISSKSVSPLKCTSLLRQIMTFGLSEDEEDVQATLEEVASDVTSVGRMMEGHVGVALAAAETPSEAMSTVMACGNTIVYLCSKTDLERGEGLFHTLAPAIEAIIKNKQQISSFSTGGGEALSSSAGLDTNVNQGVEEEPSTLIVILPCSSNDRTEKDLLQNKLEKELATILPNLVLGSATNDLKAIFKKIIYLGEDEESTEEILEQLCSPSSTLRRDPTLATSAVATVAKATFTLDSLFLASTAPSDELSLSAETLAATRTLLPLQRAAFETGLDAVKTRTRADDEGTSSSSEQLIGNYGQLCDAALKRALDSFDSAASSSSSSSSTVKRLRNELQESLLTEYEVMYEQQLKELKLAMFEKFRRDLSKIKVSPNLVHSLQEVRTDSAKEFSSILKKIQGSKTSTTSNWSSLGNAAKADFAKSMKEYCHDRLQAAKASGAYRPIPRKGVAIGLHWILPKPFGSDACFQPMAEREYRRNFVYHPDKAEVTPDEVKEGSGAWRSKIVPNPAGSDMIF